MVLYNQKQDSTSIKPDPCQINLKGESFCLLFSNIFVQSGKLEINGKEVLKEAFLSALTAPTIVDSSAGSGNLTFLACEVAPYVLREAAVFAG